MLHLRHICESKLVNSVRNFLPLSFIGLYDFQDVDNISIFINFFMRVINKQKKRLLHLSRA